MDRLSARAGQGHGEATVDGRSCEADLLFVFVDGEALMRLATWNVNSLTRPPAPGDRVDRGCTSPTCCACKRPSSPTTSFPQDVSRRWGTSPRTTVTVAGTAWRSSRASRARRACVRGFGTTEDDHGCRIVAAPCDEVRVHSVYVPNGRTLDNEFYAIKLDWLARLRTTLDETCPPGSIGRGLR